MTAVEITDQPRSDIRYPEKGERLLTACAQRLRWVHARENDDDLAGGKILDAGQAQYRVICDDNRDLLPSLDAGSVDLVVTSPPYFSQWEYATPGLGNEAVHTRLSEARRRSRD